MAAELAALSLSLSKTWMAAHVFTLSTSQTGEYLVSRS
jgi:hypothetical protein